jgi:hypothetical protein
MSRMSVVGDGCASGEVDAQSVTGEVDERGRGSGLTVLQVTLRVPGFAY